jgi:hypothetical protein
MDAPQPVASIEYLAEVAKDWALSLFAAAESSDFVLAPCRFELDGHTVRRCRIPRRSPEARNPLQTVGRTRQAVAWARSDVVTLLADTRSGTVEFQQEVVEILAVEQDDVLAEAAFVVRIPGFPPCLGRFSVGA